MNILRTVTAGIIGGILIDAFLIAVRIAPFPGMYQFIASTLVGPVAFTSGAYIGLGLLMHFAISIVFALVYALAAERSSALIVRPMLWGAVFGIAVMVVMQIVTGVARASQPPNAVHIAIGLIAHVVFFGIPVAWYIASAEKRQPLSA